MAKNNLIKRGVSLLLCTSMIMGILPINIAFANTQKNVKITSIKSNIGKEDPAYSFEIGWQNPEWSSDSQPGVGSHSGKPEGFKIMERNATKNEKFEEVILPTPITKPDETSAKVDRIPLNAGSLYEYKVLPYHNHTVTNPDGSTTVKPAPYDPSTKEETAFFMTDIKIDALGAGNSLTVTFDNPTYGGKNVFTGYRIYYQQGGANVGSNAFNSKIDINIDNKDLIPSKDIDRGVDRLTYKITNENIKPGVVFAVKVEPLYLGKELRENDTEQITINGETKKITFNPKRIKEYRTNDAYVSIPLYVTEDGKDFLKLQWGSLSSITTIGSIKKIEILSGEQENDININIGTIHGPNDVDSITNWRINKPTTKTYYKIRITVDNVDTPIESMIAVYDPSTVNITPNKPDIYPKPNILNNKIVLDLFWDTFTRPAYNKDEEALVDKETELLFDTNVLYDMWITDSKQNLNNPNLPKTLDKVSAKDLDTTRIEETENKVFHSIIEKFGTLDANNNLIEKDLQENKTYYIKIIATKPTNDGLGLSSIPSIAQIYIPSKGDISTPKALSKLPARIKKDDNGNDMITQTEITVEWSTKWFEVYDTTTKLWYSNVAIRNGELIFGKDIKETDRIIDFYDKNSQEDVKIAFVNAGYTNADKLKIRNMDISDKDINYEMMVVPFDEINANGGYEAYLEELLKSESDKWQNIDPKFTAPKYAEYTIKNLKENTRYAVLLRPYRITSDGKKEAYPTYLLATTLPKDTEVEVTPVVPTLYEVSKTDTEIEVEWEKVAKGLGYELAIEENLIDDPEKAKMIINKEEIKKNGSIYSKTEEKEFIKYKIKPLFPDTGYYIWARAIVEETGKMSDWSNPIYIRTNKLTKPEPPSGFGLASEKSLDTYNKNNNKDYKPITDKYIALEWLRDAEDLLEDPKGESTKTIESLIDKNIKKTYMAKFNELLANKEYYARAKTKVTVYKGSDNSIKKEYSYIIQLSPNKDFKDAMEIEIPTLKPTGDRILTEESDWTETLRYKTKYSKDDGGDYDGNINEDLYPLPTEDFEIIFDSITQTLIYRFRSNKKDEQGNNDNLVDQRFITNLINNKVFNYNIDLTSHMGYSIKNRRVELPYSIISAFEQRKITLTITAGGTRVSLNPSFLNTAEVKSLGKMNMDTLVSIELAQNPTNLPVINYNQTYATTPQNLKISINNNGVYKNITYTGSDMDIKLKLKDRSFMIDNNVDAYRNIGNNIWERIPSNYDSETGMFATKTNRLGNYTTITNGTKTNISGDTNTLINVNSKIIFTDLENTNMKSAISTVQFNNIVAGIANGKKEISINEGLSTQDYNSLKRSEMILAGSVVARDAGINTLIKLYGMKTKTKYTPMDTLATTPYKDIKNATKTYQTNLIKAGELGFYGNETSVKPKNVMTFEEMLYMIDIILADCGY